jgi:hypothetical protein
MFSVLLECAMRVKIEARPAHAPIILNNSCSSILGKNKKRKNKKILFRSILIAGSQ